MKKMCVSVLILFLASLSLWGCGRKSGGYTLLDVPKELEIDPAALSENADKLMSVDESTPLLCALPEEGLYVYSTDQSIASGVLIKYDGLLQYFPWRFSPRLAKPDLFISDYDADGKKDIAFTFVSGAGEHAYHENLHVLLRGDRGFTDHFYSSEKAAIEVGNHLSVVADESKPDTFTAYLDGESRTFTLAGHTEYLDLYYDEVQDFTLGDEITLRSDPGMVFSGEGLPTFGVMTYTARVTFSDGLLTQTDAQIELL